MKDYTVITPIKGSDNLYQAGETISLSDKDAAELKAVGAIVDMDASSSAPANTQASIPQDANERLVLIKDAIGKMDKENVDIWLKDGKPAAEEISAITGWVVTAAERDAAWADLTSAPASA